MNILVTGATGFVASQIVTDLLIAGSTVTCCVRNTANAKRLFPTASVIACNFIKDNSSADWIFRLHNIDVVINCVGILYHPNKKNIWAVHHDTPRALFDASVKVGVKKIIQISALGVDKADVDYATSKKAADDYLLSLPIKSVVLRPSLVYGRGSYGGTSLFRGMVGLPWIMPVPGKGLQEFQPIHVQDLSKAILKLIDKTDHPKVVLTAVGPKRINLRDIFTKLRAWLGFEKARFMFVPFSLIKMGTWFGNLLPNSSMNTTSYKMLIQNNIASGSDAKLFFNEIGFVPRTFTEGLYSQPSTVQDHWHARLYFLKPLLQVSIAFVWIFSAICSVFVFPKMSSYALLEQIGVSQFWQPVVLYSVSALDAFLGFALLCGYQLKKICALQIAFIIFYSLILSWSLPYMWFEPFAPLAKNIPLIVATLVFLALESDR